MVAGVDALLRMPAEEFSREVQGSRPGERRAMDGDLRLEMRRLKREIKQLRADRKRRLQEIKYRCAEARAKVRTRMRELRETFLREWKALQEQNAQIRKECLRELEALVKATHETTTDLQQRKSKVLELRRKIAQIRRKPPTQAQITAAHRARERVSESIDKVATELEKADPGAEKWWRAEGHKLKALAVKNIPSRTSRAEFVLEYLGRMPHLLDDFASRRAAELLKAKEKEEKALQKRIDKHRKQAGARQSLRATHRRPAVRPGVLGRRRPGGLPPLEDVPF